MSNIIDLDTAKKDLEWFDQNIEAFKKQAFVQAPTGPGAQLTSPQGGGPQGGPPMPPQGGQMPPQGDPNMPPPADPSAGAQGSIPPGLEQMLTELSGGVKNISILANNHDQVIAQLAQRMEKMEHMLDAQNKALKQPAGFEGGDDMDASAQDSAGPIIQ